MFHAQPFDSFSCISFKETYAGRGAQLSHPARLIFQKNRVLGVGSVYKILRISDEFASTFKNKQISDEFDPNFKNKQFRRIRPFLFHETKSVEFVGIPTNSTPLRRKRLTRSERSWRKERLLTPCGCRLVPEIQYLR